MQSNIDKFYIFRYVYRNSETKYLPLKTYDKDLGFTIMVTTHQDLTRPSPLIDLMKSTISSYIRLSTRISNSEVWMMRIGCGLRRYTFIQNRSPRWVYLVDCDQIMAYGRNSFSRMSSIVIKSTSRWQVTSILRRLSRE